MNTIKITKKSLLQSYLIKVIKKILIIKRGINFRIIQIKEKYLIKNMKTKKSLINLKKIFLIIKKKYL